MYDDDIEKLDLLIGCLVEEFWFDGYGFGEIVFNIFVFMVSRRLKIDWLVILLLMFVYFVGVLIIKGFNWKLLREMIDLSIILFVFV